MRQTRTRRGKEGRRQGRQQVRRRQCWEGEGQQGQQEASRAGDHDGGAQDRLRRPALRRLHAPNPEQVLQGQRRGAGVHGPAEEPGDGGGHHGRQGSPREAPQEALPPRGRGAVRQGQGQRQGGQAAAAGVQQGGLQQGRQAAGGREAEQGDGGEGDCGGAGAVEDCLL